MLTKFNNYISNKKYLILFYFEAIFFQVFILRIFFTGNVYNTLEHLIWGINTLWVIYITIYDFKNKQIQFNNSRILILFLFFIVSTISWILYQPNHTLFYFYDLIKLYEFGFIFYSYPIDTDRKEIKNTINILAYSFCTYVFVYIIISFALVIFGHNAIILPNGSNQTMIGIDNALAHKTRFMGLWAWYTIASFHCYIALCLHLYLIETTKNKIINFIGILLCAYMIYLTDSRSSLLILGFIIISYFLFYLSKKISFKKTILVGLSIILVFGIAFVYLKLLSNQKLLTMLLNNPYETIKTLSSGRIQMAEEIINNLKNHWLLGEGYGNNNLIQNKFGIIHPHNALLATLLYTGWTGLFLFLIFTILNIKQIINNLSLIIHSNFKWILILSICVVIESFFDICIIGARSTNIETLFFYLCLGIVTNTNFPKNEEVSK